MAIFQHLFGLRSVGPAIGQCILLKSKSDQLLVDGSQLLQVTNLAMLSVYQARCGLLVFMLALIATTFGSIRLSRLIPQPTLPTITFSVVIGVFLSCSPALAALIARLALREGVKDVSFRLRGDWSSQAML